MFIEQAKKQVKNPILMFILPIAFIALMVVNYIFSKGVDTNEMIQEYIKLIGVNGTFLVIILPLAIGLWVVLFWVKFIQRQRITSLTTARKNIDWKRIFLSFFIWSSFTLGSVLLAYYLSPEDFVWNFKPEKFYVFLVLAIILIPMQTSFEEYLFRGQLSQGIGIVTSSKLLALLIPSILFGLMHIANPEVEEMGFSIMIYYIGTGLFLGIITLMDDGLELALGFHAANNLVTALLVTSDWTAFQTHSIFKSNAAPSNTLDILVPVFVFFPILIFIYSKIYKWKNWGQKLTGKLVQETEI